LKITFLGTGTSQGVPVIACPCAICQSDDPRDKRLRTAAMVEMEGNTFIIDAGPDFRQQLLRAKVKEVTAILMTHEHNDHIIGMDDVRPLNFLQKKAMSVYAEKRVQEELQTRFAYIFAENPYPGAPRIDLKEVIQDQDIQVERSIITPIRAWHGQLPVFGYRFGDFTYLTDLNRIEQTELKKVKGTKILALDALHHNKHHSHLNLEEALALIERIQPDQAYLIHISHRMGLYEEIQKQLPANVALAYDGLQVEL
jgi:phosphoribosyl 1,2-cyclic phosphate phosphodiesterase